MVVARSGIKVIIELVLWTVRVDCRESFENRLLERVKDSALSGANCYWRVM